MKIEPPSYAPTSYLGYLERYYVAQGAKQGQLKALQTAVRAIVQSKLRVVTTKEEATITAISDPRAATALTRALCKARTAAKVRAILAAANADDRALRSGTGRAVQARRPGRTAS